MKILLLILIFISLYNTIWCKKADLCKKKQAVFIVIALDGFKNSYFEHTPYLRKFRETGAYTKFLYTQEFSNALNSLHTVATGYNGDRHGVTGHENGKDWCRNDQKKITYGEDLYNVKIETCRYYTRPRELIPIWTLNELNRGVSGCMMWPGSEFKYGKKSSTCSHLMTYTTDKGKTLAQRFNQVILWLNESVGSPNLVMIYLEDPDTTAHKKGAEAAEVKTKLTDIDNEFKQFDSDLNSKVNLRTRKNIIFFSDHGMVNVAKKDLIDMANHENLTDCQDLSYFEINKLRIKDQPKKNCKSHSPSSVFSFLSNLHDIADTRFGSFFFKPLKGKAFLNYYQTKGYVTSSTADDTLFGTHGEKDNDAIFMAKGSAFNTGVHKPFYLVDFYSLLAKLLKIDGDFEHDGKFRNVKPLIKRRKTNEQINWIYRFMIIFTLAIMHCGAIYHYGNVREQQLEIKARKRRERREVRREKKKKDNYSKA